MSRIKFHNMMLKVTACIMSLLFLLSGCMLDSKSWIPTIICVIALAWLTVFAYANGVFGIHEEEEYGEEN